MGARLDGNALTCSDAGGMVSQPLVAGSVQVPPDGKPILLMQDRQTIGGYPQIAHVISADLPKLSRAWPGTRIRFTEVTLDEARLAWARHQQELTILRIGLDFKSVAP
jgi:antagonist of KipI